MTDRLPRKPSTATPTDAPHVVTCERPEQIAARLLAGAGVPVLAAEDQDTFGDVGAVLHGRSAAGRPLIAINPPLGSPWRQLPDNESIPAILAVDDYAPIASLKIQLSDIRVWGTLRRCIASEHAGIAASFTGTVRDLAYACPDWEAPLIYAISPRRVLVHSLASTHEVPAADVAASQIDPVALVSAHILEKAASKSTCDWRGLLRRRLVTAGQDAAFLDADGCDVRIVAVDTYGATLMVIDGPKGTPYRVSFDEPLTAPRDVLALLVEWSHSAPPQD